ncbi:MATE family efflux transporter [Clostridium manihotivorum]|uniref:Probable multidrug resistance protein NorM n=1 Tax=Clostridium manihotivorum TaxID=2320868 RepID=A0A410DZE4_9CLOT|nr:MATE family efflux transporter [Clostridium manihotivorum]QAA34438.1 MATE family efflux transporter [Clostridium manihotivorum]
MKLIRKDVISMTLPILAEQLFVMSMGMINTMMAGHIGKEAVSAIGMVDSVNNIFIAFFSALAIGGMVVVAQFIGQGNIKKANAATKQALYSGIFIAFVITIFMFLFKEPLIKVLFGSVDHLVMSSTDKYLSITLLTYPFITIDLICNGILRGAGDTKTPMKITIFMNVMNVVFTFTLINVVKLGVTGAALGIAMARVIGGIIVLSVLLRGSKIIKLTQLKKFKLDKSLLKPIFSIGLPASVESLVFNGGKLITQIYIVNMGTAAIAANSITSSIAGMINIPGNALCVTATALVGQYMGRNDSDGAQKTLGYIIKISTTALIIMAIVSLPFARILPSLYTSDQEIINISAHVIRLNSLFIPVWSIAFVLPAGLKGAGDAKYTMITTFIGMWAFRVTLGYFIGVSLNMGLAGVWMGMFIDWVVRGILYFIRFLKGKWKGHVVIGKDVELTSA